MLRETQQHFTPLVSVIIPVYNGADYLAEAIDSALAQTYPNIEVLVINDGSNDEGATERIAQNYGERIRYFSKPNGGVATALNMGIEQMRGDYFSWLSHDDLYHADKIRLQVEALSGLNNKNTILYGGYDLINPKGRHKGAVNFQQHHSLSQLETPLYPVMRGLVNGCTLLIPKVLFERVGLFREDLRTTQDYELWSRLFRVAPVHFLQQNLVRTRIHPNQGTFKVTTHNDECSSLWKMLIGSVTPDEAEAIDGSYRHFLVHSKRFLENTPYTEAFNWVSSKASDAIASLQVSVIIPFYNRIEQTLEAIQSVRGQSHLNLEIILVNDGSTDDVSAVLKLLEEDARLRYIAIANSGPAAARNAGIAIAQGDYIAFLDSDDVFLPTKLYEQLLQMHVEKAVFSHTSYSIKKAGKETLELSDARRFSGNVYPNIIRMCPIATPTVMVSRAYLGTRRFREDYRIGEDICLWIDLAKDTLLCAVSKPLTIVHVSETSSSQQYLHQLLGTLHIGTHVCHSDAHRQHIDSVTKLLRDVIPRVTWYEHIYYLLKLNYVYGFFETLFRQGFKVALKKALKRIGII